MNNIVYYLVWVSCLFYSLPNAFAQEDLLELTKKVTQSIDRNGSTNFHIKYVQTSTTRNKYDTPQSVVVELKQKGAVESVVSAHMDFFADAKSAYAVYKGGKKILVMKDVEKAKNQMQGVSIQKVLNKLWNTASIREVTASSGKNRKLAVVPSEDMQNVTKAERLEIEFDAQTLQPKRIVLKMIEQSSIKQIEFKYLILNKNADVQLFENATAEIFDSKMKLLKKYEGFSVEEI